MRRYYQHVPARDLRSRGTVDVYGAAMAHRNLAHQRMVGTPNIRVYTPDLEQHGWQSTHTVVEIVADDMPFLVDSVTMSLSNQDLGIHLLIHPVMNVRRDEDGRLVDLINDASDDDVVSEAFIHVEVDRQTSPDVLEKVKERLFDVLDDVRAAVRDWQAMRDELRRIVDELDEHPPVDEEEVAEPVASSPGSTMTTSRFSGFAATTCKAATRTRSWSPRRTPAWAFCATRRRRRSASPTSRRRCESWRTPQIC